jgi:hypothetical protein
LGGGRRSTLSSLGLFASTSALLSLGMLRFGLDSSRTVDRGPEVGVAWVLFLGGTGSTTAAGSRELGVVVSPQAGQKCVARQTAGQDSLTHVYAGSSGGPSMRRRGHGLDTYIPHTRHMGGTRGSFHP